MIVKGDLKLEIDEQGLEVRVTVVPDENGADLSLESVLATLASKRVREEGIDTDAIEKAFRALARRKDPVSFIAAAGTPPRPPEPEGVEFESLPIPPRLEAVATAALQKASAPRGFRLREEKTKKEKKVLHKQALPFLPPKEEVEVVVEKHLVREDVAIDPAVTATGFVHKGDLVARVRPARPGKEGRSVFGRLVPPPRLEQSGFLFCEGLARSGAEVKAVTTGIIRRGATWADVVPFQDHVVRVTASADGVTCQISFEPGDPSVPLPSVDEILAEATKLGFTPQTLLGAAEIGAILAKAAAERTPLANAPISPSADGSATVTVSPDGITALLTVRKGRGGGRQITYAMATDAIHLSKVRHYDVETVRNDLQAFFKGPEMALVDYPLASGKAPERGKDGTVEWLMKFLPAEEADRIRSYTLARASLLAGVPSIQQFPIERVESMCRVSAEIPVVRIVPGATGASGLDVFGATVPGLKGATPEVRLFEGLQQRRELVVAMEDGVLEKGSDGMAILLRVRKHRDAELTVAISDDRMKAHLSFMPAAGTGAGIEVNEVRERIQEAGVVKGLDENALARALDAIARGKFFKNLVIAQGKLPPPEATELVTFHIRLATGKALTLRDDGRADFRAQDRITHVAKGAHIATVKPPPVEGIESWDVTGRPIPPPAGTLTALQAGRGVSAVRQPDGSLQFFADGDGELVQNGSQISVLQVHTVAGDVDMSSGNVNFPGIIRVNGSVQAGFRLIAGGDIEVEETVDAAILSSDGSILVGQGVKGEGRAILRAKKDITAPFAEAAVLLAVGDVRLKGACMRCQVKCNGKLSLDSEHGNIVGGEVRARQGLVAQNIGSPTGVHTLVCFGQDYLLKDLIDREEREVATIAKRILELDAEVRRLVKAVGRPDHDTLTRLRSEKNDALKAVEQRKLRLISLREAFDQHVTSEVVVRGTLYPGAVIESHGRRWETKTEKNMITLFFDKVQGKIVEKI